MSIRQYADMVVWNWLILMEAINVSQLSLIFSSIRFSIYIITSVLTLNRYNKRDIDFSSLREYNDYLEQVEDIGKATGREASWSQCHCTNKTIKKSQQAELWVLEISDHQFWNKYIRTKTFSCKTPLTAPGKVWIFGLKCFCSVTWLTFGSQRL